MASDPNLDVYRFGGIVGVIAGSLLLLWLARRVVAGRGRSLTLETKAILLGAILVGGARLAPWASVRYGRAHVTLYGDSFNSQALTLLALAIFGSAVLAQLWDAGVIRIGLIGVSLGAGVAAGLVAWHFLGSVHQQATTAFLNHGIPVFARELRIPFDRAQAAAAALAARGSLEITRQFGVYVLLGGGMLAAGGSAFNLVYGVARLFRRPAAAITRFPAPVARPSDGPLGRRGGSSTPGFALPGTLPPVGPRPVSLRPSAPFPVLGAAVSPDPAADELPAPPPMPVGPVGGTPRPKPSLDSRWAADAEDGTERRRAGGRRG